MKQNCKISPKISKRLQPQIQNAVHNSIKEQKSIGVEKTVYSDKYQAERSTFIAGYDKPISRLLNI